MAEITLRDVDLYLKRRALADGKGDASEKAVAKSQVAEMEAEFPEIRTRAKVVQAALAGNVGAGGGGGKGASWQDGVASFLRQAAQQGASRFADEFAGEVSGARRFEELRKGACILTDHGCAPGQVCLEIRVRKKDVNSSAWRGKFLDGIEDELLRLAGEG